MAQDDDADTSSKLGGVVAILSLGCFIGSLVAGKLADASGRKRTTLGGALAATVGAVVQASAANLASGSPATALDHEYCFAMREGP